MIEASAGIIDAGEPAPAPEDILDDQEMAEIAEEKLQLLGEKLSEKKDAWVSARKASGVEKRWIEDLDQYHGRDQSTKLAASMMDAAEAGYPITNKEAKPQRSTVYVNITRPKTNAAEARVANMLFPSDDRNWGLKPSPVPELIKQAFEEATQQANKDLQALQQAQAQQQQAQQAQQQAQPGAQAPNQPTSPQPIVSPAPVAPSSLLGITPQKTAAEQLQEAEDRCTAMQNEIDDQLMECQFNGEGRKLIHNAAVFGTGILKGPIVVNRVRKAWVPVDNAQGVYELEIVEEKRPASESVSPWNVFPDPDCGGDVHAGAGIFEMKEVNRKQLRELANQPGYLEDKIAEILKAGPQDSGIVSELDQRMKSDNAEKDTDKNTFQLWEYWGEFSPDDLRAAGVDIEDSSTEMVSGCIIFVNQTVIKGFLNPNETGDLPYDFFNWELVDGSPWGYGVPFLMRPAQKVLNAAWRQLMDNSGLSVGPQVLIKRKAISPADGKWELSGRKVWYVSEDAQSVADVMHFLETQNHGQEIQQIITLALQFADQETALPQLNQGEHGNAPDTVGGMTLLMNSSNVVLSRLVKQYDDSITRPHLRRYYDWNMAYSDKAEIKGDFQVDARGSSALLVKDTQSQALMSLGQFQGAPQVAPLVNWGEWFKQVLKLQHIDPSDIMKTDAEIAQLQNQPPSPPIQVAIEQIKGQNAMQLQQAKAQAEMQQIQLEAQHTQQQLSNGGVAPHVAQAQARIQQEQIRAVTSQNIEQSRAQAELARADKELEIARQNGMFDIQKMELQRQMMLLEYANKQQISLEQVKAQLAQSAMDNSTKQQLSAAEIQLAQNENEKDRILDMHKHATNQQVSLQRDMMSTPNTP